MGFFTENQKKKKDDSVKVLTEDEIRAKLYGHLLNASDSTGPIQVKKQKLSPQSTGMKPVAPSTPDGLQKSAVLNLGKPAQTVNPDKTNVASTPVATPSVKLPMPAVPSNTESFTEMDDLGEDENEADEVTVEPVASDEVVIEEENELLEEPPPAKKVERPEVNFPKVTSQDLFSGAPKATPVPPKAVAPAVPPVVPRQEPKQERVFAKPVQATPFRVTVKPQKKTNTLWTSLGKKVLESGTSLGRGAIQNGMNLGKNLSQVDYRGPWFRKMMYWGVAVAILGLLFVSIHLLNIRREAAMKNPVKPPKKVVKVTLPAAVVGSEKEINTKASSENSAALSGSSETGAPGVTNTAKEKVLSEKPSKSEATPAQGKYGIQVATYVAQEDSDRLVKRVQEAGMPAFVKLFQRGEGRRFHSVFLGPFDSYAKAQESLDKFKKKKEISQPFQDAFIRTV